MNNDVLYYWGFITTGVIVAGVVMWLAWALRNDRNKSPKSIVIKMNGAYDFLIEQDGATRTITRRLISMSRDMDSFGLDRLELVFTNTDDTWKAEGLLS